MLILTKFQMLHHSKQNLMGNSVVLIKVLNMTTEGNSGHFKSPVAKNNFSKFGSILQDAVNDTYVWSHLTP